MLRNSNVSYIDHHLVQLTCIHDPILTISKPNEASIIKRTKSTTLATSIIELISLLHSIKVKRRFLPIFIPYQFDCHSILNATRTTDNCNRTFDLCKVVFGVSFDKWFDQGGFATLQARSVKQVSLILYWQDLLQVVQRLQQQQVVLQWAIDPPMVREASFHRDRNCVVQIVQLCQHL